MIVMVVVARGQRAPQSQAAVLIVSRTATDYTGAESAGQRPPRHSAGD